MLNSSQSWQKAERSRFVLRVVGIRKTSGVTDFPSSQRWKYLLRCQRLRNPDPETPKSTAVPIIPMFACRRNFPSPCRLMHAWLPSARSPRIYIKPREISLQLPSTCKATLCVPCVFSRALPTVTYAHAQMQAYCFRTSGQGIAAVPEAM